MATNPYFEQPPAYMGYVGFVDIGGNLLRATSADIALTQEITKPDVVDGRIDKTVYQLGPQEIGGSVAFPAVYDNQGGATVVANMWELACKRTEIGTLTSVPITIKYAQTGTYNSSTFRYDGCVTNSLQLSVTQSDMMNITMDVVGLTRTGDSANIEDPKFGVGTPDATDNSRVVTWADSRIEINEGDQRPIGLGGTVGGQFVRSFEVNINNNVSRFYTLNKALFAQAVAPAKREVTGNIVFIGRLDGLGELARTNEDYAYENTSINFGFKPSIGSSEFIRHLPNVVFQIEEMAITNDLFETTMQWHSLPAAFIAGATTNATYDPLLDETFTTTY
ncbi:MAG: hypothetical protein KAH05_05090 [Clostridiales bacterium]|nr:hypothetical protein [Clostridiales bacterium]